VAIFSQGVGYSSCGGGVFAMSKMRCKKDLFGQFLYIYIRVTVTPESTGIFLSFQQYYVKSAPSLSREPQGSAYL
jgi:hypothetical protein